MRSLLALVALIGALLVGAAPAEAAVTCGKGGGKTVLTVRSWKGYSVTTATVVTYRNCRDARGRKFQRYYAGAASLSATAACAHGFKGVNVWRFATSPHGQRRWIYSLTCSARSTSRAGAPQLRYGAGGVNHFNAVTWR